MTTYRIVAVPEVWNDAIALHAMRMKFDQAAGRFVREVLTGATFTPIAESERPPDEPLMRLDRAEAQALIDSLWNAGMRPTQGKQSEGVTAAQSKHLEDMRALAFAKLEVAKP